MLNRVAASVPAYLIILRALLAPMMLGAEWIGAGRELLAGFMALAVTSDIFDGVIARRLGVVTPALRVADSNADMLFYGAAGFTVWWANPDPIRRAASWIWIVALLYVVRWAQDWFKYRRLTSYHAYSSKISGLLLSIAIIAVLFHCHAGLLVSMTLAVGIVAQVEAGLMTLVLPVWTLDVTGLWKALALSTRQT